MKYCVIMIALLLSACDSQGDLCSMKTLEYTAQERCFADKECKRDKDSYIYQQYRKEYIEKNCHVGKR